MKQIEHVKKSYAKKIFLNTRITKSQLMNNEFESETSFSAKYSTIQHSTVTSTLTLIKQKYEKSESSTINLFRQSTLISQNARIQRFYFNLFNKSRSQSELQRDQSKYHRDLFQSKHQRAQSEYSKCQQQSKYQSSYDDFNEQFIRKKNKNCRQQLNDLSNDLYKNYFRQQSNNFQSYFRQQSNKFFENHSRQLFQFDKLYKEKNKFDERNDNFDLKLIIFYDKCRFVDLFSTIYIQNVKSMLIDEAFVEFYAAKYQKRDYDDFLKKMRDFYEESK